MSHAWDHDKYADSYNEFTLKMSFDNVVVVDVMSFMSNENCKGDTRKYCSKVLNPPKTHHLSNKICSRNEIPF